MYIQYYIIDLEKKILHILKNVYKMIIKKISRTFNIFDL